MAGYFIGFESWKPTDFRQRLHQLLHFYPINAGTGQIHHAQQNNLAYTIERAIVKTAAVHDYLVWIGNEETRQQVRLIEIQYRGNWYRYITNELDAERLPTAYVVALYWQRWRIEDAYNIVKRLLGLAYFWCGAQNAVEMQVWAKWLLYVVLIDLTDAVAEALNQLFAAISIEMAYRGLYFFLRPPANGVKRIMWLIS